MSEKLRGMCFIHIAAASSDHPNKMKFKGVLVRLDEPSTKAPNGSDGHRILIPSLLAQSTLKTLIGMAVNYHPKLESHQPDRKVGVIQKAWIDGKDLWVSGIIWKKDFPDAEKDLNKPDLGMSFEGSEISVADRKADIWTLKTLCFTGATILYKDSAAYYNTSADAMAASGTPVAELITISSKGDNMPNLTKKNGEKKKIAAAGAGASNVAPDAALVAAFTAAMAPMTTAISNLSTNFAEMRASLDETFAAQAEEDETEVAASTDDDDEELEASGDDGDDDEEIDASEEQSEPAKKVVKAAKKKKAFVPDDEDDDEELDSSAADDEGEFEDLGQDHDEDLTPGHINPKSSVANRGSKTSLASSAALIAAKRKIAKLEAAAQTQAKELKRVKRQMTAAAEQTERRSFSASALLTGTMAKENLDIHELHASGRKLSIPEFDIMASKANLDSTASIAMKNEGIRLGVIDEGIVRK